MKKVLFYGNGFNNLITTENSWKNFLINKMTADQKSVFCKKSESKEIEIKDIPYTLLYDLLNIENDDCIEELKKIETHSIYYDFLNEYDIFLTTNFTQEYNIYGSWTESNIKKENKYNLFHRYTSGDKQLWFAHGNLNKPQSMVFGFEQYIGQTARIKEYLSGNYKYKENKEEKNIPAIVERMNSNDEIKSWIDYFFFPNYRVDIVGFGLGFSETDLWYILEKRKKINPKNNKIVFHTLNSDQIKIEALKAVNIECQNYEEKDFTGPNVSENFYKKVLEEIKTV